jgi:hypothetical protein
MLLIIFGKEIHFNLELHLQLESGKQKDTRISTEVAGVFCSLFILQSLCRLAVYEKEEALLAGKFNP